MVLILSTEPGEWLRVLENIEATELTILRV
jgi:hypothetical protein